jgi:hypothetical protein
MSKESNLKDEFQDTYRISSAGWTNAWEEMRNDMECGKQVKEIEK